MRRRIPHCDRFRLAAWIIVPFRGRARLALGLTLALVQGAVPMPGSTALAASKKAAASVLTGPVVLDGDGRPLRLPTSVSSAGVVLQSNRTPSYLAYRVSNPRALDSSIPTVATHAGAATTGPLYFNPAVKGQLAVALAASSSVAVNNGKSTTLLQPIPPIFSSATSNGKVLAWLASQAAASRNTADGAAASSGAPSSKTTTPAAENLLSPNSIVNSITGNSLVKDIQSLISQGPKGASKWNQESLDALKEQLRLHALDGVTTPSAARAGTTVAAAQELSPPGSDGASAVQPAPVPEPGSFVVFGLAASALAARAWSRRREASRISR
ncbi:hypothetical protein OJF2_72750 [Aquisphaera giovannonii]|uniref:Uncharacterized protein n=1 Tax=Aquisphaera giovannonii TaxID=406548 RepID=A0A5B9WEJ9_9BACT|nr:PEP-CTERM sorting domain-containing protein [Aquisphaera giovannonii]QEH38669.1 hypothetical protein OJF2_72750 [Aquisphaera giovannonii]